MGDLYEVYPRLPKNIRQIGERDPVLKLYVEDYVNTYLCRLHPSGEQSVRVGLLLGNTQMYEEGTCVFVDGALEMELEAENEQEVAFTEAVWKRAYQDVERMFPKHAVQGWFICAGTGAVLSPLNYWQQHGLYFSGKNQLMYLSNGAEGEEAIYITSPDGFYRLRGYSIFYERNQMMQDYMVERGEKQPAPVEDDAVIRDFRKRMEQKRSQADKQEKRAVNALSALCAALTIAVLAGGMAIFGNFRKMQEMEGVIASAIPEKKQVLDASGKGWIGADEPEYVIEEARGNVSPTTEGETSEQESTSEITRETMAESISQKETTQQPETTPPATQTQQKESISQTSAEKAANAKAYRTYVVQEGDTLYGICFQLYSNIRRLQEIMEINGITDENAITAGKKLLVP